MHQNKFVTGFFIKIFPQYAFHIILYYYTILYKVVITNIDTTVLM
jgi:hypothetical protein